MTLSQADQLLYSTVRVTTFASGAKSGVGTAFIYTVEDRGGECALLVTNKHVLQGADALEAVFHQRVKDGPPAPSGATNVVRLNIVPGTVAMHPDPDVDLCAICISETLNRAHDAGKPIFYVTLGRNTIPAAHGWKEFDAIEEVIMVGCPNGIFDEVNNIPIVRRGTTATPLAKDYNGARQFVIDMACFPGSSGSPIFVYDRIGYFDRRTDSYKIGQRQFFVGVLFAGPLINQAGQIIFGQAPSVQISTMMHLGYALKSRELLVLEDVVREQLLHARP